MWVWVCGGGERRDDIGTERREVQRASDGEEKRIEHNGEKQVRGIRWDAVERWSYSAVA